MIQTRIAAVAILIVTFVCAYLVYAVLPFKLGLDLQGGTHLVYRADTSVIAGRDADEAMEGLRDVIERRINFFGVTEPLVQVNHAGDEYRLIVELAGVFDINQAIQIIGQTPFLEFRTERPQAEVDALLKDLGIEKDAPVNPDVQVPDDLFYLHSELTGRFLKEASLSFGSQQGGFGGPSVSLQFNDDGAALFREMTRDNIGKTIAIYLDGAPISIPVVQDEIAGGQAQITGKFTAEEARDLVNNLNSGALPVPISLISQQNIGPTLGARALAKGVNAGIYALIAIAVFLLVWYRLPGLVGIFSLAFYTGFALLIFKILGITLTTAGITGFILSVGMAVDANILIFERLREEIRLGKSLDTALREGFWRAWPSIRDANISTIITSAILFWFGTSIVKGFALTLGIGVIASMFSAFAITRTYLFAVRIHKEAAQKFLYGSSMK
ncbi:MAG: protein translocase subunit SecD [Candidatus Niyogibacteria bacterium]|nr:protein translocase subunit SecD [Candidatus Niyogibacteria bacterium]